MPKGVRLVTNIDSESTAVNYCVQWKTVEEIQRDMTRILYLRDVATTGGTLTKEENQELWKLCLKHDVGALDNGMKLSDYNDLVIETLVKDINKDTDYVPK